MKTRFGGALWAGCCCLELLLGTSALAQAYSIQWQAVNSGGGMSADGVYSLNGAIGRPDAGGAMNGGVYSLAGGLLINPPAPPILAPSLSISLTSTNTAILAWPSVSPGWNLLQSASLANTNWIPSTETLNDNGTNKFVIIAPAARNTFYRLSHP